MGYSNGYGQRYPGAYPAQQAGGGFYSAPGQMTQPPVQSAQAGFNGGFQGGFCVQPVTSREEAVGVIADPMCPGVLLPDLGHGVIFFKRFNPNTGSSDFGEFRLVQPAPPEAPPEYITRTDLDAALAQLRGELTAKAGGRKKEASDD